MEADFLTLFESVRRSFILLLSLTASDILKQSKLTDNEIDIIKNIALEKLHRQRNLKEIIVLDSSEKQFSD